MATKKKETRHVLWYFVGEGSKIHAVPDGNLYTICGIGGNKVGPFYPRSHTRGKKCEQRRGNEHERLLRS